MAEVASLDETRNDLLEEIKHKDVMSEKYKKTLSANTWHFRNKKRKKYWLCFLLEIKGSIKT